MKSLAAQIIDQQVSGIAEKHTNVLAGELRLGSDRQKLRSAAFVFLVARTAFDLADQEAFDGIVDGANDFGVDALYFDPPDGGELPVVLIQGKYRASLSGDAAFPENGIAQMIDAIDVLFDPERPVTLNRRLNERVEEIRSLVKEGAIPNPVMLRDLRANDRRQQDLAASIAGLGYQYRIKREDRAVAADEITSPVVVEAVMAVWRRRPHQARFRSRDHFGALYDTVFTKDLNGAQAVTAALLLRKAESRRKNAPDDAPDFLAYGSRFSAMLVGRFLLEDMGITLDRLDHRNFEQARQLIDQRGDRYLSRAERLIDEALGLLLGSRPRTLQRLSATFRRADLVDLLLTDAEEKR